jgi:AcrR family transcriptional regulator
MATPASRSGEKGAPRLRAQRMQRDERTARILSAARDFFCAHGYRGTVVADIAREIGISEATVFKYFPTKQDLLNRVIESWYGQLFLDYSQELGVIQGARNRFRYLVWRHFCSIRDWPDMCRLIFADVRSQPGYPKSVLHKMNLRYTGMLVQVAKEGARDGEFRADIPFDLIRDTVFGAIEHHAWSFLYAGGRLDAEKSADKLTDLICGGLATPAAKTDGPQAQQLSKLISRLEVAVGGIGSSSGRKR